MLAGREGEGTCNVAWYVPLQGIQSKEDIVTKNGCEGKCSSEAVEGYLATQCCKRGQQQTVDQLAQHIPAKQVSERSTHNYVKLFMMR